MGGSVSRIQQLYSLAVRDIRDKANQTTTVVVPACPICGREEARATFALEGMSEQVLTCTGCELGRLLPQPTLEQIATYYPSEYYGTQGAKFEPLTELLVRLLSWRRARFLVRGLPLGARILDVGCGRGTILSAIAACGYEAHGFERDWKATGGLIGNVQLRVADRLSEAGYPSSHFQLVVLWHVLEHLPDVADILKEIHRLLVPGGRLVVAVPNFSSRQAQWAGADSFHLDLPRHLFHFPVESLRLFLEKTGFTVRSEHHFSLRHNPFGWVQSALNRFRQLPRNSLYVLLQRHQVAVPFSTKMRWLLKLVYFLTMPWALLLSIRDAWFRRGATVHLVAERQ